MSESEAKKVVYMDGDDVRFDATTMSATIQAAAQQFNAVTNVKAGHGTSMDKTTHAKPGQMHKLSRNEIRSLLANSWVCAKGVQLLPTYCVKRGVELAMQEGEAAADEVKTELEHFGVLRRLFEAHCAARAFGGAKVLILVDDGEVRMDDPTQLDMSRPIPRDEDGKLVGIKEFYGVYVIEGGDGSHLTPASQAPEWATTEGDGEPNLVEWRPGPHFGEPIWWEWNPQSDATSGDVVPVNDTMLFHRDRLVDVPGRYTDRETRKLLGGWDLSAVNAAWAAVHNYESAFTSATNIVYDFYTVVSKIKNYKAMTSGGDVAALVERLMADAIFRSVLHMHVCDADDEDLQKIASPVAGLDDLMDKFMDAVCGAFDVPRSLMFNEAPQSGGRDEVGEAFMEDQASFWHSTFYAPALRKIVDVMTAAERRSVLERRYQLAFPPLRAPSVKEEAEAYRTFAHGDEINVKAGIVSREEARTRHTGIGVARHLRAEGDEPPDVEEVRALQAPRPGFAREAGQNTEAEGKVPNAGASDRTVD